MDVGTHLFDGRFETLRLIKQSNGVATFLGVDHLDGARVVINSIDASRFSTAERSPASRSSRRSGSAWPSTTSAPAIRR